MPLDISQIFIFIAGLFQSIFGFIVGLILKISTDFSEIILLILSGIGGYFLIKNYDNGKIKKWVFYAVIILMVWLMLRWSVMGGTN